MTQRTLCVHYFALANLISWWYVPTNANEVSQIMDFFIISRWTVVKVCPACSSANVTKTATTINSERTLTDYRCNACSLTWAEVTPPPHVSKPPPRKNPRSVPRESGT